MTKLLERISSILFSSNHEADYAEMYEKRRRPLEILEGISFDGENFQRVYQELLEYLQIKDSGFSIHEKELLKGIIDSVTCEEDEGTPLGMKTTSILKKKRNKVAQKLKASYPPVPHLNRSHPLSEVVTKQEEPLAEQKPVEKKEYVVRDNGRRAKVFSARFDEDYEEILAPPEPIQVEKLPFSSKPAEVPRIALSFSQESGSSLTLREQKALLEEAQSALELENKKALELNQKPLPVIQQLIETTQQNQLNQSALQPSQILTNSQTFFEIGSLGSKPMTLETIASPEPLKLSFSTSDKSKEALKPLLATDEKKPFSFLSTESKEDKKALFTLPKEEKQETKPALTFSIPQKQESSEKKAVEGAEKKTNDFTVNFSRLNSETKPDFKFGEPSTSSFTISQPFSESASEKPKGENASAFTFNFKPSSSTSTTPTFSLDKNQKEKPTEKPAFSFSQPTNTVALFPSSQSTASTNAFSTAPTASNITTPAFTFDKSQEKKPLVRPSFSFSLPSAREPTIPPLFPASQPLTDSGIFSGVATEKPAFSFNQPSAPPNSSMDAEAPVTSGSQSEALKSFSFSQGSSSQSSVFTFGSTQTPSQSFVFGNSQASSHSQSQPSSQPFSFNFGAKSSAQPAPFSFGASASQPTPSFNFGASSSNSQPLFSFGGNKTQNDGPAASSPQSSLSTSSVTTSGRMISRPILKRNR